MSVVSKTGSMRAGRAGARLDGLARAIRAALRRGLLLAGTAMATAWALDGGLASAQPIAPQAEKATDEAEQADEGENSNANEGKDAAERVKVVNRIAADRFLLAEEFARVVKAFPLLAPVQAAPVAMNDPAAMQAEPGGEDGDDAQMRAIRRQLEPYAEIELSFAHRVCDLDERQLASAGEAFGGRLDQLVRKLAPPERAQQGQNGIEDFMDGARRLDGRTSIERLQRTLIQALEPLLNADQLAAFRRERTARETFRRETIVDNLLIILDQRLTLTDKQRADIRQALLDKWNEAWTPPLHAFQQTTHHIPEVPDDCVTPWITPQQCRIYQGLQKVQWGGFQINDPFGFGESLPRISDVRVAEYQAKPPSSVPQGAPADSAKNAPPSPQRAPSAPATAVPVPDPLSAAPPSP